MEKFAIFTKFFRENAVFFQLQSYSHSQSQSREAMDVTSLLPESHYQQDETRKEEIYSILIWYLEVII